MKSMNCSLLPYFKIQIALTAMMIPMSALQAAPVESELKFNESYITPIVKSANNVGYNANSQVKEAMSGKPSAIPKSWRLVNAVGKLNGGYVLFFQDKDASVHSIGIDAGGLLSGTDLIVIPSH
jgi:hypothetical protein